MKITQEEVGDKTEIVGWKAQECCRLPTSTRSWRKEGWIVPQSLQREHSPAKTLILDVWPLELWNNKLLLFWNTQCLW